MATPRKPKDQHKPAGRPSHAPTAATRTTVAMMAAIGTRYEVIGQSLQIGVSTLTKYYPVELRDGLELANAKVAASLYNSALKGNLGAQIFWLKTRAGWRDVNRHEHTGADGAPIQLQDMSGYSDEQLETLRGAAIILGGTAGAGSEQS
jgi:hypothetical protein